MSLQDSFLALEYSVSIHVFAISGWNPPSSFQLRNLYFDRHLFQPLLRKTTEDVVLVPDLLNDGEAEFVNDLKDYLTRAQARFSDKSLFLVRNPSRGSGVGFFVENSFYPDFILWVREGEGQTISFIDPKGLIFIPDLNSPKLTLYRFLQNEIMPRLANPNVHLNAFIISTTAFDELRQRYSERALRIPEYEERHVLFQYQSRPTRKQTNYIERMFDIIERDTSVPPGSQPPAP